jgi:AraC-like DNA-binding protein
MPSSATHSLHELLCHEKEQIRRQSFPPDTAPSIQRAASYIHNHLYDPNLNVAKVLDACDISANTFSQRFRARLGHTPHRYIQHRRIEVACALLERGVDNVFLVGLSVGYARYRTFLRNFKGVTGQTPSEYLAETQSPDPKT